MKRVLGYSTVLMPYKLMPFIDISRSCCYIISDFRWSVENLNMRGLDFKRLSIFLLVGLGGVIYLTAVSEYFPCQVIPCLYNHFDNETSPEHPEEKTISDLSWSSTILWNENPVDGQVISEQYKCANEGVVVSGDSLNKRQRRLPNVLLIGAKKCGTGEYG